MNDIRNELQEAACAAEDTAVQEQEQQAQALQEAQAAADTAASENAELIAALIEARVKLALLLCGVDREKLDEGTKLAVGFVGAGMQPDLAAEKAVLEYPHLRLAHREVPVFAAQSHGSTDGFAAIRSIFGKR